MITQAITYGNRFHVVARATLAHPLADEVSLSIGSGAYANFPHTVELAFFRNGEWVTEIIPELAEYAFGPEGDTRVYAWVPQIEFSHFLENFSTGEE